MVLEREGEECTLRFERETEDVMEAAISKSRQAFAERLVLKLLLFVLVRCGGRGRHEAERSPPTQSGQKYGSESQGQASPTTSVTPPGLMRGNCLVSSPCSRSHDIDAVSGVDMPENWLRSRSKSSMEEGGVSGAGCDVGELAFEMWEVFFIAPGGNWMFKPFLPLLLLSLLVFAAAAAFAFCVLGRPLGRDTLYLHLAFCRKHRVHRSPASFLWREHRSF